MVQRQIVPDVWSLIFSHLEPCFLADVACVSKSFNHIAFGNTVFINKLKRYFPHEDLETIPVPESERQKDKFLFRTLYAKKFSTLKSSASRRLLSYIIEEDIEQIRKFNIDGDSLFDMLKEEDADGNDMLFYINRSNNITLCGEIIKLYVRHEVNIIKSWNPLTILDNWIDKIFRKVFDLSLNKHEVYNLFTLAAAFNLEVIKSINQVGPELYFIYDEALVQAVRFNHIETIEILLSEPYNHFKGADGKFFSHYNPLVAAAKYNQAQAANLLLAFEKIGSDFNSIEAALTTAVECHSSGVFDALLTAYLTHPKNNHMNVNAFMDTWLFHHIIENGHADLVEKTLQRVTDLNDVNFEDVIAGSVRRAIHHNHIEVIQVFLKHGYIPHSLDRYAAKSNNQPEMAEMLREARNKYKQSNPAKLGR